MDVQPRTRLCEKTNLTGCNTVPHFGHRHVPGSCVIDIIRAFERGACVLLPLGLRLEIRRNGPPDSPLDIPALAGTYFFLRLLSARISDTRACRAEWNSARAGVP